MKIEIDLGEGHMDALRIIISDAYPYADERNLSPVFEEMIEDYLLRENGRLGYIVEGKWTKRKSNS